MIRNYYWRVKNCGCRFNEVHDDELNTWTVQEVHVTQGGKVYTHVTCDIHKDITNIEELYKIVHTNADSESKRVSGVYRDLFNDYKTDLFEEVTDKNGEVSWQLKPGIKYDASFSGVGDKRVLNVSIVGFELSSDQKSSIQLSQDSKFGVGKVIIN